MKLEFIILLLIVSTRRINADCCDTAIIVEPQVRICPDGSVMGFFDEYCGYGSCNIFGCACVGGCRVNSKGNDKNEARELYNKRRVFRHQ